jgi:ubiquinone/menaquinone biosynthesis C-methylase UbiE
VRNSRAGAPGRVRQALNDVGVRRKRAFRLPGARLSSPVTTVPIDFHDAANQRTYSDREADASWREAVTRLVDPTSAVVIDVGCGGGTYARAWHDLGAATVTGVDFSGPILDAARETHGDLPGVSFRRGEATATGLPGGRADVVFERALVHHVPDLPAVAAEAARLLRPGGTLLVQDRTPEDVAQPGSVTHPRGWLLDVFPRLLEVENRRRPHAEALSRVLASAGFGEVRTTALWEVRRRYARREDYLGEIAQRTGRSILHELSDDEIDLLVRELRRRLPEGPIVERDRWTVWRAVRAAG